MPSPWNSWLTEGGLQFRWRRTNAGVIAEWVGVLTLRVDSTGRVETKLARGADPVFAGKLKATGAAAFVRALRGQPSLHGSAVARGGRAIVCLGESGAGKSTAAATLCAAHGFALLADDVAGLEVADERWWVQPTEASYWLEGEGCRKQPILADRVGTARAQLTALVRLRFGNESPRLSPLRGGAAFVILSEAAQRFERSEALGRSELDLFASIAQIARLYDFVRPRSWSARTTAAVLESTVQEVP